jgi:hypothetical protein
MIIQHSYQATRLGLKPLFINHLQYIVNNIIVQHKFECLYCYGLLSVSLASCVNCVHNL